MALYSAPPVGKGSKATCPVGFSIPNKVVNGARSASLGTHYHVPFAENKQGSKEVMVLQVRSTSNFRAAFKFGQCVHFALRSKMLISSIARLPALLLDFINSSIGETGCIYEANVK